jgi:hypothetical protein
MATFYQGYRSVLRGRDADNFVHTYKGTVGVYSNYSLMDTAPKMLAGFPDNEHVLGGLKHARILEYIFAGKQHIAPLNRPGNGARLTDARYNPLLTRGLAGARVFKSGYGHVDRDMPYSNYSNFIYDGLPSREVLKTPGHVRRFTSIYGYAGAFDPFVNKGTGRKPMLNPGTALPTGYDYAYGKNKINEWRGTPSNRAL